MRAAKRGTDIQSTHCFKGTLMFDTLLGAWNINMSKSAFIRTKMLPVCICVDDLWRGLPEVVVTQMACGEVGYPLGRNRDCLVLRAIYVYFGSLALWAHAYDSCTDK